MEPMRNKLDAQERAHLEAMIRRNATPEELNAWRKERSIHHKTFNSVVRHIRLGLEAPPSPMADALATMEQPAHPVQPPAEAPAVITPIPATARPAQIEPVVQWLTTIRAMRDELAQHGVTVAGSLRIEIEL